MTDTGDRVRTAAALLFALIAIALGGSSIAPGPAMLVQLAAIAAIVASVAMPVPGLRVGLPARAALVLVGLAVLAGVAQLVPLSAERWQALPGRQTAQLVYTLVSVGDAAHPLTLDPEATRRTLLALLPFLAGLIVVMRADYVLRYRLALLLVAIGLFDLLLGALQFATRGSVGVFYPTPHALAAVGLFANRNHNADLLLIAPLIAAAVIRWDPLDRFGRIAMPLSLGLLALFVLGVLIASSRMGVALLAVAVPVAAALTVRRMSARSIAIALGAALLLAAILAAVAYLNPVAGRVFARFGESEEGRLVFWPNVLYAIETFLPWGSGLGTFQRVYASLEPLESLTPYFINHAHNEYLEIALEMGVPGIVLMAGGVGLFLWVGIARLASAMQGRGDPLALAALAGIAILLLHSLVDYPLRTPALAALFGMLWGFGFDPLPREPPSDRA